MPNIDEIRIVGQEITYDIRPKEDASHQNVSAEEKAQWNAKSDFSGNYADLQGKPDLSQFVTKAVDDLTNYYLKSETYTKQEVQQLLSSFNSGVFRLVDTLPTASAATTGLKIYLVPSQTQEAQNVKDEFITIEENGSYRWEQIGSTAMSLDGYVTETALNQALSSYVTSSAFTSALAQKQDTLVSGENIKTVNGESILGSGNIVAGDPNAIKYTEQSLTDSQKTQARTNIGAAAASALTALETAIAAKYSKPASGIPEADLNSNVQSALALARTSIQSLAEYYNKTEVDALLAAVNSEQYVDVTALPTASASTLGKIYLVGPDANGVYTRHYTSYDGSTYSWVSVGTTDINLANYATKAELDQLGQEVDEDLRQIYGKQAHTFLANSAEHSSLADMYEITLKAGDTLTGVINRGTGDCDGTQMRAYVYNQQKTAITFVTIEFGVQFSITPVSDAYYLSFYLWKVTTFGTFEVEFETPSIVGDIENEVEQLKESVNSIDGFQDSTKYADMVGHNNTAGETWLIINKLSKTEQGGYLRKIKAYITTAPTSFYVCIGELSGLQFAVKKKVLVSFDSTGSHEADLNIELAENQYIGVCGDGTHKLPGYGPALTGTNGWLWKSSGSADINEGSIITLSDLTNYSLAFGWSLEYSKFEFVKTPPVIVEITATRNSADFNSIREIVSGINDASSEKRYVINVPEGRWFECDLNGKPYITIKGNGRGKTILYCDGLSTNVTPADYSRTSYANTALSDIPQDQKHCIFALRDMDFCDLSIEVSDVKYCAHLDQAGWLSASFENVQFIAKDNVNYPVGMGIRGGQKILFNKCVFERTTTGLGFVAHNWNNQQEPCGLSFLDCYFKRCGFGVLNELGSEQNDKWEMINCFSDACGELGVMVDAYNGATYWTNPSTGQKETDPTKVPYCISLDCEGSNVSVVTRRPYGSDYIDARPNALKYIYGLKYVCINAGTHQVGDVIHGVLNGRTLYENNNAPAVGVIEMIIDGVAYISTNLSYLSFDDIDGTPSLGSLLYDNNGRLSRTASGSPVAIVSNDAFVGYRVISWLR